MLGDRNTIILLITFPQVGSKILEEVSPESYTWQEALKTFAPQRGRKRLRSDEFSKGNALKKGWLGSRGKKKVDQTEQSIQDILVTSYLQKNKTKQQHYVHIFLETFLQKEYEAAGKRSLASLFFVALSRNL